MKALKPIALFLLIFASFTPWGSSAAEAPDARALKAYEAAGASIGKSLSGHRLTDQDGRPFTLKDLEGKPYVLSLIYTNCTHTCGTITARLAKAFKEAGGGFGDKFTAVTVGFDAANDTPQAMRAYGENFTDDFKKWRFASADAATIERLVKDTGFFYQKTETGFDHLNAAIIVGPDGKVFRQVYGMDFEPEAVLEAVYASISPAERSLKDATGVIDFLTLLCYTYDAKTGTYRIDYTFLMAVFMAVVFQALLVFMAVYLYRGSRAAYQRTQDGKERR